MTPQNHGHPANPATTAQAVWAPTVVDMERPNAARVYDYYLGGSANLPVDRQFAEEVLQDVPAREFARANRTFLRRVVEYLVREAGIRQFLDLGSGLPTIGNVHEIAQRIAPDCRVVYVDVEPVAVAYAQRLLDGQNNAAAIGADLRSPYAVLGHPDTRRLLDFNQPVAVLLFAVLHFVPDEDDPSGIITSLRNELCPGSHLAISHATADNYPDDLAKAVEKYQKTATPATLRTHHQVTALFDGFTLLPPGVVFTPEWRPEGTVTEDPRRSLAYGGVAVL